MSLRIPVQELLHDPDEQLKQLQKMEEMFYGSKMVRKDADAAPAAYAYSTLPTWVQPIFGRKVWSHLNFDKNVAAIIPKERWIKSGYRMCTAPGQSAAHAGAEQAGGISRGGALPATIGPTIVVNSVQPKEIMHTWGVLEIDAYLSSIDDSVAIAPFVREELGLEHASIINTMLVQSAHYLAEQAGGNWAGSDNLESLDRLISSNAEETALTSADTTHFDAWVKYGLLAIDRDGAGGYDAIVNSPGTVGVEADLTLTSVETTWRNVIEAGGKTDVILTGADFIQALSEILEPERRFIGEARVLPNYGGVKGLAPGVEAGFSVATLHGIPMIPSISVRCTDATHGDTISHAFYLDTEYLRLKIAIPTKYMETPANYTTYLAQDKMRIEGGYVTTAELLCYRFNTQAKLTYIK